jgi:hypothetical protein
LLQESNIYKPNWSDTFLQEASNLVQMQTQAAKQAEAEQAEAEQAKSETQPAANESDAVEVKVTKKDLTDADREKLAQELIAEEENFKVKQRKKSVGKK